MPKETWKQRVEEVQPALEKKRFSLSREPVLQDRLRVVKEVFERFQKDHPGVLGLSINGSMSKGYAEEKSDIDGELFVAGKAEYGLWGDFSERLRHKFGDEVEINLQVHFVSMQSIDVDLADARKKFEGVKDYFGMFFRGISFGRSLDEYRRHILMGLRDMGESGEAIWRSVIDNVRKFERPYVKHGHYDPAILEGKYEDLYPQTIDDAIKYFVEHKPFREKKKKDTK